MNCPRMTEAYKLYVQERISNTRADENKMVEKLGNLNGAQSFPEGVGALGSW